jgi:excisionase family DNA binding protein
MITKNSRDYTVREAAERLSVPSPTIYSAIACGKMISFKRGATILIIKEELDRWNKIRRR